MSYNITNIIGSVVAIIILMFAIFLVIWHFWVFPTLLIVLNGLSFVSVTAEFAHALYWFTIGASLLISLRVNTKQK